MTKRIVDESLLRQVLGAMKNHGHAYLHHEAQYKEAFDALRSALDGDAVEPVGEVTLVGFGGAFQVEFNQTLPAGTKLYAAPQPVQKVEPTVPETLLKRAGSPEFVETGNHWQQGYEHARAWVLVQLSAHGIKEQS